jgi:hypothetical protein
MTVPENYLAKLAVDARALPNSDVMGQVLSELLEIVATGRVSFHPAIGAANSAPLYKRAKNADGTEAAPTFWGAFVQCTDNAIASFVHELTHASCLLSYKAEMINYAPGGVNVVQVQVGHTPPPGCAEDLRGLTEDCQKARRAGWKRKQCGALLTLNLRRLEAWAKLCNFTTLTPFESAAAKAQHKDLTKKMSGGDMQAWTALTLLQTAQKDAGKVIQSRKYFGGKAINKTRLDEESARKRAYILDRCAYGLVGQGGQGDPHFEYDTVVNQMLYQMYLWGFREAHATILSDQQLRTHAMASTVPATHLYSLIAAMADEARLRRRRAFGQDERGQFEAPGNPIAPPPSGA